MTRRLPFSTVGTWVLTRGHHIPTVAFATLPPGSTRPQRGTDPGEPPPHNGVSHCPARSRSPATRAAPGPAVPGLDSALRPLPAATPGPSQPCRTPSWVPHSQGLPRPVGRVSPFSRTDTHSSPSAAPAGTSVQVPGTQPSRCRK